jgi:hypothetical protein
MVSDRTFHLLPAVETSRKEQQILRYVVDDVSTTEVRGWYYSRVWNQQYHDEYCNSHFAAAAMFFISHYCCYVLRLTQLRGALSVLCLSFIRI